MILLREMPDRTADGHKIGLFRCSCGKETTAAMSRVKTGYTKSCGCLPAIVAKKNNTKHGRRNSGEYRSWQAMLRRCCVVKDKDYPRYGGAGVTVYESWKSSFLAFFQEVGERPKGTTLDRIDANKGYEPGNIRWATPREQSHNRRDLTVVSTPRGVMALVDYAKAIGISKGAAHLRMKRGKLEGVSYV